MKLSRPRQWMPRLSTIDSRRLVGYGSRATGGYPVKAAMPEPKKLTGTGEHCAGTDLYPAEKVASVDLSEEVLPRGSTISDSLFACLRTTRSAAPSGENPTARFHYVQCRASPVGTPTALVS